MKGTPDLLLRGLEVGDAGGGGHVKLVERLEKVTWSREEDSGRFSVEGGVVGIVVGCKAEADRGDVFVDGRFQGGKHRAKKIMDGAKEAFNGPGTAMDVRRGGEFVCTEKIGKILELKCDVCVC